MDNILTVIIPVRNRAELVVRTLESLRRQTAAAFDTVLVDNGSSDGTLGVLERWAATNVSDTRPVRVLEEPLPGAPAARNAGLAVCTTPWVLFFDSDDEMLPSHISRVLDGITVNPDADIIGWDVLYGEKSVKKFRTQHMEWYNLFEGNFATQRWAAKTELVKKTGGWNNAVRLWNDIEIGARMLALTPRVIKLKGRITVRVYPQSESISTNKGGDYMERIDNPLQSIRNQLRSEQEIWIEYIRMIVAGNTYRSAKGDKEIQRKALNLARVSTGRAPSPFHRKLLWATFHFRRLGGRGQNRILRLLIS